MKEKLKLLVIGIMAAYMLSACCWYVDFEAPAGGDGLTWATAFNNIQDGVDAAEASALIKTVCVKRGTYVNSPTSTIPVLTMKDGVEIYGGFEGWEPSPELRGECDPVANGTILDGEDTSYHVVIGASDALLDCFTVTDGNANATGGGWYNYGGGMYNVSVNNLFVTNCTFSGNLAVIYGGGMYNWESSPTITNCTFNGNSGYYGGGMANSTSSSPEITNCTFSGNSAEYGGGIDNIGSGSSPTITNCTFVGNSASDGGGMANRWSSLPTITNCTFTGNSAASWGGGMLNSESSPTITNCIFNGNSGNGMGIYESSPTITNCIFDGNSGSGMSISSSTTAITNCIFSENSASRYGGGISLHNSSSEITNCTFVGNSGPHWGGGMHLMTSSLTITNCIFWGNTASIGPEIALHSGHSYIPTTLNISYSDVQGGEASVYIEPYPDCTLNWGEGNIGEDLVNHDPLFVSGLDGDYYLSQIAAGQGADSPCVDAGSDTAVNLGLDDRTTRTDGVPDTDIVDMGYHYEP